MTTGRTGWQAVLHLDPDHEAAWQHLQEHGRILLCARPSTENSISASCWLESSIGALPGTKKQPLKLRSHVADVPTVETVRRALRQGYIVDHIGYTACNP